MEFRPCIDIHNGKVKQIVGSSLKDAGNEARENFVASFDADHYALIYKEAGLKGGHIILLNSKDSEHFEETKRQALKALSAYPGGMQIGGGINPANAGEYIKAGASHVIVTSYCFADGEIKFDKITEMSDAVGAEHLVLDLSCKCVEQNGEFLYRIVTDRWQKETDEILNLDLLEKLSPYCDEFLIHAVDVEGKNNGPECKLCEMLSEWGGKPITYAGGIRSVSDIELLREIGRGKINYTIGSALDIFGGSLSFEEISKLK